MQKNSFVIGAVILAISGIVCKILGAVYKIPLANILGSQGIGLYYLVFPIYVFLLSFISSSFTVSISRRVSRFVAREDNYGAYMTLKSALILLVILGSLGCVMLVSFAYLIANLQGESGAVWCYIAIAPSLIAVGISSVFKGYFHGLQNMIPTAISQVLEQVVKLSVGFSLALMLCKNGVLYGTLGALLGVSFAEIAITLFFVIYFFVFKKRHKNLFDFDKEKRLTKKVILKEMKTIFFEAIPFTLNSVIMPLSLVIDSFLIVNILKSMSFEGDFATSLLGINSGVINTLVGLPSTLSTSLCLTLVPFITFSLAKNDFEDISSKSVLAIKLCFIISIPCVLVFLFFAPQVLKVLYSSSFSSSSELAFASAMLTVASINVFYLAFLQLSTALLQAIGKSYIPVVTLFVSILLKLICEVALILNLNINIVGAVLSNAVCYFVSCFINLYFFKRYIELRFSFFQNFFCPFVSSALMCLIIFLLLNIFQLGLGSALSILLSFAGGAIFYVLSLFAVKVFTIEDTKNLFRLKKQN